MSSKENSARWLRQTLPSLLVIAGSVAYLVYSVRASLRDSGSLGPLPLILVAAIVAIIVARIRRAGAKKRLSASYLQPSPDDALGVVDSEFLRAARSQATLPGGSHLRDVANLWAQERALVLLAWGEDDNARAQAALVDDHDRVGEGGYAASFAAWEALMVGDIPAALAQVEAFEAASDLGAVNVLYRKRLALLRRNVEAASGDKEALAEVAQAFEAAPASEQPWLLKPLAMGHEAAGDEAQARLYSDLLRSVAPHFGVKRSSTPSRPPLAVNELAQQPTRGGKLFRGALIVIAAVFVFSLLVALVLSSG